MQPQDYKDVLRDTVRIVFNAENEVFTAMVNLGFSGEYADISRLHQVGEELDLELAMFEDTPDENLNLITSLVKQMMRTRLSLMNLNSFTEEDLSTD
jgi:hypothetical protein